MAVSPERDAHYRRMGLSNVKDYAPQWSGQQQIEAREWIAQMEAEEAAREVAHRLEEIDIARSARDAAHEANEVARDANSIALAASASAERSAVAAIANNKIARAALIAAVIAIVISIIGVFMK